MASPEEIAFLESQIGRPLEAAEAEALAAELGGPAPMPMAPSPDAFRDQVQDHLSARLEMEAAHPSLSPESLGASSPVSAAELSEYNPALAQQLAETAQTTAQDTPLARPQAETPPLPIPQLPMTRARGGSSSAYGREADAARADVEAARGASAEALGSVRDATRDARDHLRGLGVDRDLEEQELADSFAPKRDAAEEAITTKRLQLEDANRAAADTEITDRRTKGQRIMSALAVAFGSISQLRAQMAGAGATPNIGMALVEKGIERDLAEQRANLANARDTAEAAKGELAAAHSRLGDVRESEAVARAAIREKYAIAAQDVLGTLTDEKQIAELEGMIQGLGEKSALEREAIARRREALARQAAAAERKRQHDAALRTKQKIAAYEQSQNLAGGLRVTDPQRFASITAGDPKQQSKVVSDSLRQLEKSNQAVSVVDQIRDLQSAYVARSLPKTEANNRLEGLKGQLQAIYKDQAELGALDNGVIALTEQVFGDVTSITDLGASADKLDAYRAQVVDNESVFMDSRGLGMNARTSLKNLQAAELERRVRPRNP